MANLKAGDKLVFDPDTGKFKHLQDPHWIVKLIVGGLSFFLGSPEETLGGTWQCSELTEDQARIIVEMIARFQGLKVARSYDDPDERGIVLVMGKGKRSTRYRDRDWLSYSMHGFLQHGRPGWWLEEWEKVGSWDCSGLTLTQFQQIAQMCADLLDRSTQRHLDEDDRTETDSWCYEFVDASDRAA